MKKAINLTCCLVLALLATALLFTSCAPQLGSVGHDGGKMGSSHFKDGKFFNTIETRVSTSSGSRWGSLIEFFTDQQKREPEVVLPSMPVVAENIGTDEGLKVTWLGHSTSLIEMDGQVILADPMFSDRASPFSFMGPKRFTVTTPPIEVADLPKIDVVLISHDHYDHLDFSSIKALKNKTAYFYVPLGVGGHLERWGVPKDKIVELDWWEEQASGNLTLAATPARHFSGRWLTRNNTLWASWVIRGKQHRVFFGGDSGYFNGFKQIGNKYGPFDITLLESGAYNEAWSQIHMMPEETVQAHLDLKGKVLLPIHWGQFNLAMHSWREPIERLVTEAERKNVIVATPLIGQTVAENSDVPQAAWWKPSIETVASTGGTKDLPRKSL
jgi:L-ascorbate metabolism protein UlaG (beta-lactamase superfamily)